KRPQMLVLAFGCGKSQAGGQKNRERYGTKASRQLRAPPGNELRTTISGPKTPVNRGPFFARNKYRQDSKHKETLRILVHSTTEATTISSTLLTPSSVPMGPSLNWLRSAGFQLSREPSHL